MNEKTIVSASTLAMSLLGYWYAKRTGEDSVPYILVGGFLGAIIGERLVNRVTRQ